MKKCDCFGCRVFHLVTIELKQADSSAEGQEEARRSVIEVLSKAIMHLALADTVILTNGTSDGNMVN